MSAVLARAWDRPRPPERILAIRLQAFGDTVLTLPYLSALRRLHPHVRLDFLTRGEVADVPRRAGPFDRVHELPGGRRRREQLLGALALLPRLAAARYDVVLDLQANDTSRLCRRVLRPAAWAEFDRFSARLAGERTRRTIEAVGLGRLDVTPDLSAPAELDAEADTLLRAAGWNGASALVVLNPAGSLPGRNWPAASWTRFAELWAETAAEDVRFVTLGFASLAPAARALAAGLGPRLLDLTGRTSAAAALAVLRRARLVVSEDSGLMHLAWAAGVPTLGLFGASRAGWSRPHGTHTACVATCALDDGACLSGRCGAGAPSCLAALAPERVAERARAVLLAAAAPRRIEPGPD